MTSAIRRTLVAGVMVVGLVTALALPALAAPANPAPCSNGYVSLSYDDSPTIKTPALLSALKSEPPRRTVTGTFRVH